MASQRRGGEEREVEGGGGGGGGGGGELQRWLRKQLEGRIEREVLYVAEVQKGRSINKDRYFLGWSAVGSHVAYMVGLPVVTWSGYSHFGRHLTLIMALGLMGCNFLKDLLALPRPSSPPVARLSSSHLLEFGFPSSHSVNALNLPLFAIYYYSQYGLERGEVGSMVTMVLLVAMGTMMAGSISYSRIYCGMHCPTDLLGGFLVGFLLLATWIANFHEIDRWLLHGDNVLLYSSTLLLLFVWAYPVPPSPTPSFDDAISFGFVCVGIVLGTWRRGNDPALLASCAYPGELAFDYARLGPLASLLRLAAGVSSILLWRAFSKFLSRLLLPPLSSYFLSLFAFPPLDAPNEAGENERKRSALFARFNSDLITKAMVYIGIGYLTVDGAGFIFDFLGVM